MSLTPGTRLGSYDIVGMIGAGGMGVVYRARDARLGRDVAIKVLPGSFADDANRRDRFEREARAVAALSHPNVINVFDTGLHDGHPFVVMELLDGETLRDRLAGGALGVRTSITIAVQIARGLAAAHDKQIVHRDIKPENIFIGRDGHVKILDFGLAREISTNSGATETHAVMTDAGTAMGTVWYMAPEQIRSQPVDGRADIFAFGAVLFEMLSGARAFRRDTQAETMTAILKEEAPDLAGAKETIPAPLDRIVRHCLEKNQAERFQSARDVAFALESLSGGAAAATGTLPVVTPAATRSRWRLASIGVPMLVLVAAASWWLGQRAHAAAPAWSQFTQLTDASGVENGPTISADGTEFAFSSNINGTWDIYVQRVGGRNPLLVAGDPEADEMWPAFSPDSKQIAFNEGGSRGGVFIVGATGESARRLTDFGMNPAWSPDGQKIAFSTGEMLVGGNRPGPSTLWIIDVSGGEPKKIDEGDGGEPAWSPSGRRIAFYQNVGGKRDLVTMPSAGGERVLLTNDLAVDWAPTWSPDGQFMYFASDRGGSMGIWRIGIEEASGRATGAPESVAAGVDVAMDLPHLTADGGTIVFRSMIESVNPASITFDPVTERAGDVRLLQHRTGKLVPSSVSPDGQWIALSNLFEKQQDVFIMKPDGSSLTRLTDDSAFDWLPRFTPDGTALGFKSNKGGVYDAWSIKLDGSGRTQLTRGFGGDVNAPFFSPDGKRIGVAVTPSTIVYGPASPALTPQTAQTIASPKIGGKTFTPSQWSNDGRWWSGPLFTASGVPQGNAIYEVATGALRQLSDDAAGLILAWLPGDTRVAYLTNKGRIVVEDVVSLKRHELDITLPFPPDSLATFAIAPDGRTLYYGARQTEANIWKVEPPKAAKR